MIKDIPSVNLILKLAAIATLVIGLLLLFYPSFILKWLGVVTTSNEHFAVYLGTALIGFSITNWLYSTVHDAHVILPALYGNVTSLLTASVIDAAGIISGQFSIGLWLVFAVHVIFLAAFIFSVIRIKKYNL